MLQLRHLRPSFCRNSLWVVILRLLRTWVTSTHTPCLPGTVKLVMCSFRGWLQPSLRLYLLLASSNSAALLPVKIRSKPYPHVLLHLTNCENQLEVSRANTAQLPGCSLIYVFMQWTAVHNLPSFKALVLFLSGSSLELDYCHSNLGCVPNIWVMFGPGAYNRGRRCKFTNKKFGGCCNRQIPDLAAESLRRCTP